MKNTKTSVIIILLIVLSVTVYSQLSSLSHTQYFVIPENAERNDYVGYFHSNLWHDIKQTISFSLSSGNEDGIFTVDPSSGLIRIKDNSKIDADRADLYKLIIKTSDGPLFSYDTAFVLIKKTEDCIFINPANPEYTGVQNGTREYPYNSWNNIKFQRGKAYFQKRGTVVFEETISINIQPVGSELIIIAAYSQGSKPVLDGNNSFGNTSGITVGAGWRTNDNIDYIRIYDFYIRNFNDPNATGNVNCIRVTNGCKNFQAHRVEASNAKNGGIYLYGSVGAEQQQNHKVIDCVAFNNMTHGIKVEASYSLVENCTAFDNARSGGSGNGISIPEADHVTVRYCECYNNNNGIAARGSNSLFEFNKTYYNTVGINAFKWPKNTIIRNSRTWGNGYHGIGIYDQCEDITVENVESFNNREKGIRVTGEAKGTVIKNCRIYDNLKDGITIDVHPVYPNKTKNTRLYYNLICNNNGSGISAYNCSDVYIYNNTFYGNKSVYDVNILDSVYNIEVKNTIYKSIRGKAIESNNINYTYSDELFENPSSSNFYLKKNSPAINAGINLGFNRDINNNSITGNPDIGAFEFTDMTEADSEFNNPPNINNQIFYISINSSPGDLVGKVFGSDPDTDQQLNYYIKDGNINNTFSISTSSGDITLDDTSYFSSIDTFKLTIEVRDNHVTSLSDSALVLIIVSSGDQIIQNQAPVIEDQNFYIYESDEINNYIGRVNAYDPDADQSLTYEIISGNDNDIFIIDSESGNLSIKNVSNLSFQDDLEYDLTVQVYDNSEYVLSSNALITIYLMPQLTTYYIDPSNTNDPDENGTIEHPFDSWADLSWQEGFSYLQKRGTVATEGKINIRSGNVTIGAYGEGDKPEIYSTASDFAIRVFEESNIIIENLYVIAENAISCIYFIGSSCDNNVVENCKFEGAENGIRVIDGKKISLRYNTFIGHSDAIYSFAETTEVYYNVFKGNYTGINISSHLSSTEVYNNVFYDNTKGVSTSYSSLTVYNNIFYLTEKGTQAINHSMDKLVSDNNIFYPEQEGFIDIGDKKYSTLSEYQSSLGLDIHSFNTDPLFRDVYNDNFNVEPESPAIDAGINVGISMDFLGYNVPYGRAPDIGLLESLIENADLSTDINGFENGDMDSPYIYPNPSDGEFKIYCNNTNFNVTELQIRDIAGNLIYRDYLYPEGNELLAYIDITSAPNGVYIVFLSLSDRVFTQRIMIN